MTHLLDSSALLAYYFGEPGAERVLQIVSDTKTTVGVSVLSAAEFWSRLRIRGADDAFELEWKRLSEFVPHVVPVSLSIVVKSIELRRAATARLPYVDALIAATAAESQTVLVHRDPHFAAIPDRLLKQEMLPIQ